MTSDYGKIVTGLIESISGFRKKRPSASRKVHLVGLIAETAEVIHLLRSGVLEYVRRHIVLETSWHIDFVQLSDDLLQLELPAEDQSSVKGDDVWTELTTADSLEHTDVETIAQTATMIKGCISLPYLQLCQIFNNTLSTLSGLCLEIADEQSRHRTNEEYEQLYYDEAKRFNSSRPGRRTRKSYDEWREDEAFGYPDLEELKEYRFEKLLKLLDTGILDSKAAHIRNTDKYIGEIDFESVEEPEQRKRYAKLYAAFRRIVDLRDGMYVVNAYHAGHFFYRVKDEPNMGALRNDFLKYIKKIELAQAEMLKVMAEEAEAANRQDDAPEELNFFAPTKQLKLLLREEWFGMLTVDEKKYGTKWTDGVIDRLMASKWGEQIARDWAVKDKRLTLKCMIVGIMKDAGIIKGSYNQIAKLLDMEGENPSTLAKYMGQGKKQGFSEWIVTDVISE